MSAKQVAIVVPAVALLLAGCATKDWVNQVIGKERAQTDQRVASVDERVGTLDGRVGEESKRVDTLGSQVKESAEVASQAHERAEGAMARADGAMSRADGALGRANEVDGRVTRLWNSRHKRSVVDTLRVQFGFDRYDLDDGAQTALLTLIDELKKNPALGVVLEGYTDPRGARGYNLELARRRVEAVRRHLVTNGIEMWRIDGLGLGPIDAAKVANAEKRRVTVTLTLAE